METLNLINYKLSMNMNCKKLLMTGVLAMISAITATAQAPFSLSGKIDGMPDSVRITLTDVEDPN